MDKKYLNALEFDKVLALVARFAKTKMGHQATLDIIPFDTKHEIEAALNLTSEAKLILDNFGLNSFPLDFISDPKKILTTARLSVDDIISLTKTITSSRKVKNYLAKEKNAEKLNTNYKDFLICDKELEDKVYSVFDDNFNIRDNASPELKKLKNSLFSLKENLKNSITDLLKNSTFTSYLQDTIATERMGRTVFQVKASDKSKVKGIVHDVSASYQTYFIEPECLVNINNKIRQTECEIEAEIERILYLLSKDFLDIKEELIVCTEKLTELDVIFAKAEFSIRTKSTSPIISDERIIKLYSMAHPFLIENNRAVRNDFEIGEDYKALLITGSNTGGKTVCMKTIGLNILMAKSGMHVLSEHAVIFPFKNVWCDIEEKQDIARSLSTFSAHIKNIAHILDNATKDDIVFFDELGTGTDPTEGASIAKSILKYLEKKDVISISTTHLGELKLLEFENSYYKNASVEFDKESLKPTYKLIIGLAGSSYAIDIAQNYGLNPEIIQNARNFLNENSNPDTKIFNKIQQTHEKLLSHTKKIEKTKISNEQKEEELNEKLKEIKEKKKKTLDVFKKKYKTNFESARLEIKKTLDEIRKEKSEKIIRKSYAKLAKLEEAARLEFTKDEDELLDKYPKIDWGEIQIGQNVLVVGINQPAILKSMPDNKQMVEIQMGLIKSKIHISKLAKTDKKVSKGIKKLTVSFDDFHASLSFSPKLDLRGMRADEALDALEHHLDLAIRRNISQFTVITGHGLGILKKVVKEYLNDSPYVSKYRTGDDTEGKDGVYIVDVK